MFSVFNLAVVIEWGDVVAVTGRHPGGKHQCVVPNLAAYKVVWGDVGRKTCSQLGGV